MLCAYRCREIFRIIFGFFGSNAGIRQRQQFYPATPSTTLCHIMISEFFLFLVLAVNFIVLIVVLELAVSTASSLMALISLTYVLIELSKGDEIMVAQLSMSKKINCLMYQIFKDQHAYAYLICRPITFISSGFDDSFGSEHASRLMPHHQSWHSSY